MNYSAHVTGAASRWQRISKVEAKSVALGLFAIAVLVAGIAWLSASRHYFGFGTETDFLGGFLRDASAFLHGRPLEVQYQPPLYPIFVAVFHLLVGDWFTAGRVMSLVSSAVVLVTSFFFYRLSVSTAAAWGAIAGLAISPVFIAYSAFATSDVFFLALYSTVLLLAYLSERRSSTVLWCATGVVLALALLTRANALTLILVAAIPALAKNGTWRTKVTGVGSLIGGTLVPILAWVVYARISNSNLWPLQGTKINLALTYFPPHKGAGLGDSVDYINLTFSSVWDVIFYDPFYMVTKYLKDLYHVFELTLSPNVLFAFPSIYFVLPALVYFFLIKQPKWVCYVIVLAVAQLLLVNFKDYASRYYLFLVPVVGALVAEFVRRIYWSRQELPAAKELVILAQTIVAILAISALIHSYMAASASVHRDEPELSESIPIAQQVMDSESLVVARKPVLSFYTGAEWVVMPPGQSAVDLLAYVADLPAARVASHRDIYIYYGTKERQLRPEYRELLNVPRVQDAFPELELLAHGRGGGQHVWMLYRYRKNFYERIPR